MSIEWSCGTDGRLGAGAGVLGWRRLSRLVMRAMRPEPGVLGRRLDPGTASEVPRLTCGVALAGGGVLTLARLEDQRGRVVDEDEGWALAALRAMDARVCVTLTSGTALGVLGLLARVVRRASEGSAADVDGAGEGPVVVVVLRVARVGAAGAAGAAAAAELLVVLEGRVDMVRGGWSEREDEGKLVDQDALSLVAVDLFYWA